MTQDEIIEMARLVARQPDRVYAPDECEFLYYFANLIAQHEREACVKAIEDQIAWDLDDPESTAIKAIQKRSGV